MARIWGKCNVRAMRHFALILSYSAGLTLPVYDIFRSKSPAKPFFRLMYLSIFGYIGLWPYVYRLFGCGARSEIECGRFM